MEEAADAVRCCSESVLGRGRDGVWYDKSWDAVRWLLLLRVFEINSRPFRRVGTVSIREKKVLLSTRSNKRRGETPGSERRERRDGAGLGVWQRLRGLRSPEKQHPHPWKIDQARKRNKYLEIGTIDRGWSWKGRAAPSNWVSGITALRTRITADATAVPR